MKRIYEQRSYGKELVGYEYNGYIITIEEEFIGCYGNTRKWYYITLKNGEKCCSDKLYEVKQKIDED